MTAPFVRARQRGTADKVGQPNPMGLFEAMTAHVLDAEIANTALFLASELKFRFMVLARVRRSTNKLTQTIQAILAM